MVKNERIVCVILNYNDAELSKNAAGRASSYDLIDKVVVVDNCSTDNSYVKLQQIASSKITVIQTDHNGGYGYGNNYGIDYAQSVIHASHVLIANPDVEFSEGFVYRLKQTFREKANCAIAAGLQCDIHGRFMISAWKIHSIWYCIFKGEFALSFILDAFEKCRINSCGNANDRLGMQKVDCVAGALLMIDAEKFIDSGGYDEELFLYMEETVLGTRLKEKGYDTYLCTDVSYLHMHGVSISKLHDISARRKMLWESTDFYLKKYKGAGRILRFFGICFFKIGTLELVILNLLRKVTARKTSDS